MSTSNTTPTPQAAARPIICVNIHCLRGDETGFSASARSDNTVFGHREGLGATVAEALQSLAWSINREPEEFEFDRIYDESGGAQ